VNDKQPRGAGSEEARSWRLMHAASLLLNPATSLAADESGTVPQRLTPWALAAERWDTTWENTGS